LNQSILRYFDRSHPDYKTLSQLITGPNLRGNVALKSTPKGREQRQFEITKVNALNWMTLEILASDLER
jgi:hypothetical protein